MTDVNDASASASVPPIYRGTNRCDADQGNGCPCERIARLEQKFDALAEFVFRNADQREQKTPPVENEIWLTVDQVAERLGREPDTIRKACRENGIGEPEPGRGKRRRWRVSLTRALKHFRV